MRSLKLNSLESNNLSKRELSNIRGGNPNWPGKCGCGCLYEGEPGGSSTFNNMAANDDGNKRSDCAMEDQIWTLEGAVING